MRLGLLLALLSTKRMQSSAGFAHPHPHTRTHAHRHTQSPAGLAWARARGSTRLAQGCTATYACMYSCMYVMYVHNPNLPRSLTCSSGSLNSSSSESSSSSSSPCARLCACLTGHVCVRARAPVCVRVSGRARVRVCVPRLCVFHRSLGCRPNFAHIMMCSEHRYRHTA